MSVVAAAAHVGQYEKIYATAKYLDVARDDWAVVCYFYAVHRAVRAAFCIDERLNSDSAARAVSDRLRAGSRHVDFHKGHPNRGPGVNDVNRLLYPEIADQYELLHSWSCEVRYENGLSVGSIADARKLAETVLAALVARGVFEPV